MPKSISCDLYYLCLFSGQSPTLQIIDKIKVPLSPKKYYYTKKFELDTPTRHENNKNPTSNFPLHDTPATSTSCSSNENITPDRNSLPPVASPRIRRLVRRGNATESSPANRLSDIPEVLAGSMDDRYSPKAKNNNSSQHDDTTVSPLWQRVRSAASKEKPPLYKQFSTLSDYKFSPYDKNNEDEDMLQVLLENVNQHHQQQQRR